MIVNYKHNGWEIITQRSHGLLAAQLAYHWRKADRPARWVETLVAIADHDDAQVELEREDLLTPGGGPLDFKMRAFDLNHCKRTIELSLSKSRYIALLCAMHLDFVYGSKKDKTAAELLFFKQNAQLQSVWRKELKLTKAQARHDYHLLEWCDALSLLICQHENQPEKRKIEISRGTDNRPYNLIQLNETTLSVDPWPFECKQFDVCYEMRVLPQLQFSNSNEFKTHFKKARAKTITWKIVKHEP